MSSIAAQRDLIVILMRFQSQFAERHFAKTKQNLTILNTINTFVL